MRIRVVDYVANLGGGVRFAVEMIRALSRPGTDSFELVSHGAALDRYRRLLPEGAGVRLVDLVPRNLARTRTWMAGIPGAGPLNRLLGTGAFHFEVPPEAVAGCDVAWFPWIHRHRLTGAPAGRVVASLHDLIVIDFRDAFPSGWGDDERETVRRWLGSDARVVVSSEATASALGRIYGARRDRVSVVPLSGRHARAPRAGAPRRWPFSGREYLLCPANTSPHKNHEILLRGLARWGARHPLVLTGDGTDFFARNDRRARELQRACRGAGLRDGESVFGLGYVDEAAYEDLLDGAWALVMPTLAEGGGSFPVWEAMERGIPAVVSDIPVMREMVQRTGGEVLWFDPQDSESLSRVLADLEENHPAHLRRAREQTRTMRPRTWGDVATDYARLMSVPAAEGGRTS
jgi:glycosyltransferase involved in cell wall biosynthesis